MAVPLRIWVTNSGQNFNNHPAKSARHGDITSITFKLYNDVSATVNVSHSNTDRIEGTFVSKRDKGSYNASLKRATSEREGSRRLHYDGWWRNGHGKSGKFGIEFTLPDDRRSDSSASSSIERPQSVNMTAPMRIEEAGTREHPVFLARDIFKDMGLTIMMMLLQCFREKRKRRPEPVGRAAWRSWNEGDYLRVYALIPWADFILAELRRRYPHVKHIMTKDRGYQCKDVNVYSEGGSIIKHQDSQKWDSLVFIFCAGLSCNSFVWLHGWNGDKKRVRVNSGDCMIFEGQTPHAVTDCIPGTSPFNEGEWLANRRISILIRQKKLV